MNDSAVSMGSVIRNCIAIMKATGGIARRAALPAAALLLSGCGPETLKPSVPLDMSLTPAAIYVLPCPPRQTGLLGFMGAMDSAPGEATCSVLWTALQARLASMHGLHVLLRAEKGNDDSSIKPDLGAEKELGAAYRVILGPPWSHRSRNSDGNGGGIEWIETNMTVRFVSVADGKELGRVLLNGRGSPMNMAMEFSNRIVKGIEGPRCQPMNRRSMKAAFKNAFSKDKCDSLALHADDDD